MIGWAFPPRFCAEDGSVATTQGVEDILQSLRILFSTRLGERLLAKDYGTGMDLHLFRPLTLTECTEIRVELMNAIARCEPRITVHSIALNPADAIDGILRLLVSFSTPSQPDVVQAEMTYSASTSHWQAST